MKIIPYGRQSIDGSDIASVVAVLKSDWITQGPTVERFEQAVARYCNVKYAVAFSSGTAALHGAYLAAGFRSGDEIITTPNTFAATTNMMLAAGARPIFCDIRLDTYNIDETKIERLITKKTRAIVPVHFAGHPCEMGEILRIARKHGLIVIEDAAQAFGARYAHRNIGSLSDMTMFSFHPVKSITTGEGGAIVTNSKKYYEKLLLFRSHGMLKKKPMGNVMVELGYNYRMTDIQAALGLSQLKKLRRFLQKRHIVAQWYKKELGDTQEIVLPRELPGNYSAWHLYVVRVRNPHIRNGLREHLRKNRIGTSFHYPAVPSHPYYRKRGYALSNLKNEMMYEKSCITLPCYPALKKSDVLFVSNILKKYVAGHSF